MHDSLHAAPLLCPHRNHETLAPQRYIVFSRSRVSPSQNPFQRSLDRLALRTPTLFPREATLAPRESAQILFPTALGLANTAARQARACPARTSTAHAVIRAAFRIPKFLPPSAT